MMMQPVELVPLKCTYCDTLITPDKGSIIWFCETCGQGQKLDDELGLVPIEIHYAMVDNGTNTKLLPFWVAKGRVTILQRESDLGQGPSDQYWVKDHTFFVPAFDCSIKDAVLWGMHYLHTPLQLKEGERGESVRVTIDDRDAQTLAEFIVLSIEAERRDRLKNLEFDLNLQDMVLWVIPVALEV